MCQETVLNVGFVYSFVYILKNIFIAIYEDNLNTVGYPH
jgi:hypothetical protein